MFASKSKKVFTYMLQVQRAESTAVSSYAFLKWKELASQIINENKTLSGKETSILHDLDTKWNLGEERESERANHASIHDKPSNPSLFIPKEENAMFLHEKKYVDFFRTFWHSSAHILGYALEQYYGDKVKLCHGPPSTGIPYCFFYEVCLEGAAPTDSDLKSIQRIINRLLKETILFEQYQITKEEGKILFGNNPYKLALIDAKPNPLTVYKSDAFIDLCCGPHLPSSQLIQSIQVVHANYVETKTKEKHYRFYGNSFLSKQAQVCHTTIMKEARDRDHRIVGKKLNLFLWDPNSPGNVWFLSNGLFLYNQLIGYMKRHYLQEYFEIASPLLFRSTLWKQSGHYDHYRDNMYHVDTRNSQEDVYLKPMNCPSHCIVYNSSVHSYRDLPIRYSEFTAIHRQEDSGAVGGLTRLNMFHQDDGHIFCRPDQITSEISTLVDTISSLYSSLGFQYSFVLSTQPSDSVGQTTEWNTAEMQLKQILEQKSLDYSIEKGDGAFYAPKIDVLIQDSLYRRHQCGTIQLDVQLPKKFGLKYKNSLGEWETPILIHRAIYGSLERFMGVFIEHCNGRFPLFFSPYQVAIVPFSESHMEKCKEMCVQLKESGVERIDITSTEQSFGKRMRECIMKHYNYIIVIGDTELSSNTLSVRKRGEKDANSVSLDAFRRTLKEELNQFK